MIFLRRSCLLAASLITGLALVLSGCSGSGSETEDVQIEPTSDARAQDEQVVTELYNRFWQARIESENSATVDQDTYEGLLEGSDREELGRRIAQYEDNDLVRVGEPSITEVEVSVTGDTATIFACIDEDDWRAESDGELLPRPEVKGNVPTGATAERQGEEWILTALNSADGKECA